MTNAYISTVTRFLIKKVKKIKILVDKEGQQEYT